MKGRILRNTGDRIAFEFGDLPETGRPAGAGPREGQGGRGSTTSTSSSGTASPASGGSPPRDGIGRAGVIESTGAGVTRVKPGDERRAEPRDHCGECEFCLFGEHSLCVTFHLLGENIAGTFADLVVAPLP